MFDEEECQLLMYWKGRAPGNEQKINNSIEDILYNEKHICIWIETLFFSKHGLNKVEDESCEH